MTEKRILRELSGALDKRRRNTFVASLGALMVITGSMAMIPVNETPAANVKSNELATPQMQSAVNTLITAPSTTAPATTIEPANTSAINETASTDNSSVASSPSRDTKSHQSRQKTTLLKSKFNQLTDALGL